MSKTIYSTTISNNLCINCGICETVCSNNAIELRTNSNKELVPYINKSRCTNCGICSFYCPMTKDKIKNEAENISSKKEPQTFGLENAHYYIAWSKDKEQRQKSCSGGATTEIAKFLFENKIIDAMIHVERLWANKGEMHYGARISLSVDEITKNVSSAYQPINFSDVLKNIDCNKVYFITGTPCIIRGIKNLFLKHDKYKNVKIITCALICSHNTNSNFIDYLLDMNNLSDDEKWQVNIRHKDNSIIDANNFKNHIYTKECSLMSKNRFDSGWTHIWRNYYFALNSCLYCSDFWGYSADISIKDAWGDWAKDPLGKSIVIIRNNEIDDYFKRSNILFEELDYEIIKNHQFATSEFKQIQSYNKNFKSIFLKCNRVNKLLTYKILSYCSKFLYKNYGFKIANKVMNLTEKICVILEKI